MYRAKRLVGKYYPPLLWGHVRLHPISTLKPCRAVTDIGLYTAVFGSCFFTREVLGNKEVDDYLPQHIQPVCWFCPCSVVRFIYRVSLVAERGKLLRRLGRAGRFSISVPGSCRSALVHPAFGHRCAKVAGGSERSALTLSRASVQAIQPSPQTPVSRSVYPPARPPSCRCSVLTDRAPRCRKRSRSCRTPKTRAMRTTAVRATPRRRAAPRGTCRTAAALTGLQRRRPWPGRVTKTRTDDGQAGRRGWIAWWLYGARWYAIEGRLGDEPIDFLCHAAGAR